jgi:phosphoserine/homoserine phosphotransferase
MTVVCLDLEGVLTPEMWIALADSVEIEELRLTTRDVPDYDALMRKRIQILAEHDIRLPRIQEAIRAVHPLAGAARFLDSLRSRVQVVILSDTFSQFAGPLMEMLGRPTIFCNDLIVDAQGRIVDYRLRQEEGKRRAVEAFASLNLNVVAGGDSYNDLAMIRAAHHGFLFSPPGRIRGDNPSLPAFYEYDSVLKFVDTVVASETETSASSDMAG